MSMAESIQKFLHEDQFEVKTRSDKLLQDSYEEAKEQDRLFDFLKWLTEQTDGRAVPKKDQTKGRVSLAEELKDSFTVSK